MNAKQNAKLNSYRATEKHIDDNAAIIASTPAFQTAFTKFKAKIAAIIESAEQKSAALTGVAADKKSAKQNLCQLAATVAGAIYAYASANKNETLRQEMNLSVTTLLRARDETLAPLCQLIHDRATANLTELADYGINARILGTLQTAINAYSAETVKPRTAVSTRKTINANFSALFREADNILKNQLDKLIELFRPEHPDFVQTYESTRMIVDPPKTVTQLKGKVIGKSSGQPIKDVTVNVVEANIRTKTDSSGEYLIKPISPSKYTIRLSVTGFQDFEQNGFEVKLGEINKLNVELIN